MYGTLSYLSYIWNLREQRGEGALQSQHLRWQCKRQGGARQFLWKSGGGGYHYVIYNQKHSAE